MQTVALLKYVFLHVPSVLNVWEKHGDGCFSWAISTKQIKMAQWNIWSSAEESW